MALGASRPGGITINERRKLLKAERRAAQIRVCALCPTRLSMYNPDLVCGACSIVEFNAKPRPVIHNRTCWRCRGRFLTEGTGRCCPSCRDEWDALGA